MTDAISNMRHDQNAPFVLDHVFSLGYSCSAKVDAVYRYQDSRWLLHEGISTLNICIHEASKKLVSAIQSEDCAR